MSTTESASSYDNLEKMSVGELLTGINNEDKSVAFSVEKAIPQMTVLVQTIVEKMKEGGRLFYIGAGTSGRLGVVDASEIPPTYGVPHGLVIGIIAGGDGAIRKAVENAEDDAAQAWKDLSVHNISSRDFLIGIAASGRTPYVIGGLQQAHANGVATGCVTCNAGTEVARVSDFPVEIVSGAEFVTGSTRMKAGTAQKLALNMISTAVMIQLGHVRGNKMIDMQLTNFKLVGRAKRMIMEELGVDESTAATLLEQHGSIRKAVDAVKKN